METMCWSAPPDILWDDNDERGVYKTTDGGKTWKKVLAGANGSTGCGLLAMSRQEPKTIYASMWDFRRQGWTFRSGNVPTSGSGLFKSTDGGDHWTEITDSNAKGLPAKPWGRVAIAVAPSKPQVVYANVEAEKGRGLYRSDDGGANWTKLDASNYMVWRPFYFGNLIVDPKDENKIFKPDLILLYSTDGGKTFNVVSGGAHGDFHDVWINPKNPNVVIAGDDGGLWRSEDGGNRWKHQMNLPISQFYHVSTDNSDPYHVYGGLQDNSSWVGDSSYPGGVANSRWENMFGGDGFWMFEDPSDPNYIYAEAQGGEIGRVNRYTHEIRGHQAAAQLRREETALQLEHADSHEPQRERDDLHWRAVPVPLARSWPVMGSHFAGPDDERSGEAEAGRVRRRDRGQFVGGNAHHDLFDL